MVMLLILAVQWQRKADMTSMPAGPGLFSEFQASQLHGEIVSQTPNRKRAPYVG